MTNFSKDQAAEIVEATKQHPASEVLMLAPDVYQGLRNCGALEQLAAPYIVNPRLVSGRWEFTENPPAKLMERVHGPAVERV